MPGPLGRSAREPFLAIPFPIPCTCPITEDRSRLLGRQGGSFLWRRTLADARTAHAAKRALPRTLYALRRGVRTTVVPFPRVLGRTWDAQGATCNTGLVPIKDNIIYDTSGARYPH